MSALTSLSAQYTDSEGEESAQTGGRPSSSPVSGLPASPAEGNGVAADGSRRSGSPASDGSVHTQSTDQENERAVNRGLVSYLGDEDDAVGDSDVSGDEREQPRRADSSDMEISHSSASDNETSLPGGGDDSDAKQRASNVGGLNAVDRLQRRQDNDLQASPIAEESNGLLPPEPSGCCSRELQEKVANLVRDRLRTGADMNGQLKNRKHFRNPSIYEKLLGYCNINEFGTNCPPELYDPTIWGEQSFYEELAKVQKEDMERREKERKERTKVEVVTVTKKLDSSSSAASGDASKQNKRSKWDIVGAGATGGASFNVSVPPPGVTHPVASSIGVISSSTVIGASSASAKCIPAFGNIVRKR